jgi:hypothetical protein
MISVFYYRAARVNGGIRTRAFRGPINKALKVQSWGSVRGGSRGYDSCDSGHYFRSRVLDNGKQVLCSRTIPRHRQRHRPARRHQHPQP